MGKEKRKKLLFGKLPFGNIGLGFSAYRLPSGYYLFINLFRWNLILRS